MLTRVLARLNRQLAMQVLPDGGHYERAPAYHCQVLADLIDVADLVRATGREPWPELADATSRMRSVAGQRARPGRSGPAAERRLPRRRQTGEPAAARPGVGAEPLLLLPDTGLVRAAVGDWFVLADVGPARPGRIARGMRMPTRSAAWSMPAAHPCSSIPGPRHTRRARSAAAMSGPPRRTTRSRWTAPTPPRSGGCSGLRQAGTGERDRGPPPRTPGCSASRPSMTGSACCPAVLGAPSAAGLSPKPGCGWMT